MPGRRLAAAIYNMRVTNYDTRDRRVPVIGQANEPDLLTFDGLACMSTSLHSLEIPDKLKMSRDSGIFRRDSRLISSILGVFNLR